MNREHLVAALRTLLPGIAKQDIVEQFGCFTIQGKDVRVTNGRLFIRAVLDEDTGVEAAVPARVLYSLLSSMSSPDIEFISGKDTVTIKGGAALGKLMTKKIETSQKLFEIIQEPTDGEWLSIPEGLLEGLKFCKFSASKDLTTGVLTGVTVNENGIISCDRYRITCYMPQESITNLVVTLPVQLIQELEKHTKDIQGYCVKSSLIFFKIADGKVIIGSAMLPGEYPDVLKYLPECKDEDIITLPDTLPQCLDRQMVVQSDVQDIDMETKIKFDKGKIILYSIGKDVGEVTESIDYETPTGMIGVEVSINPSFFKDFFAIGNKMAVDVNSESVMILGENLLHLVKTKGIRK